MEIVKTFQNHEIQLFKIDGEYWFIFNQIAEVLGYSDPKKSASKIYTRNKAEFEGITKGRQIGGPSGTQTTRIGNTKFLKFKIYMHSTQPVSSYLILFVLY